MPDGVNSPARRLARPAFAVVVSAILLALGVANIVSRAQFHHIEDGVLWSNRPEGVTATAIAPGSAAAKAGIQGGDILLGIDGKPVQAVSDIANLQTRAPAGAVLSYSLVRLGSSRPVDVVLTETAPPGGALYYLLAAVGLFTLVIGAAVRLRRPADQATLHFFWLSVAFFGTFTFSFNGPFDRLDWVFYWGDAIATAMLPALLLHFTLTFPERKPQLAAARFWPFIYVPPAVLIVVRVIAIGSVRAAASLRILDYTDRAEYVFVAVAAGLALVALAQSARTITSLTARRQLRWLLCGVALGAGPFVVGYVLPWTFGANPPLALQLTAIPLGLIPLTFASAIVRYRLRDVEVIVKSGLVYAAFFGGSALLYFAFRRLVMATFGAGDPHGWLVALLATLVVVLVAQPVKQALQAGLDRLFYRDRYDYRRALVAFARDLNSDLNIDRLAQRLVSRIGDTMVVDRIALLVAEDGRGDFRPMGEVGFDTADTPALSSLSSFAARLHGGHIIALDGSDPTVAARFQAEDVEYWRDQGIFYFVPCLFDSRAIAVLALGREDGDEPFNSEDLALLTAVAGQVATAIENGRLYQQLSLKADELGRMREFNENILESLDEGLVVFDEDEQVIRWNHALESFYGVPRATAIGRTLEELFGSPVAAAIRAARHDHPHGVTLFKVALTPPEIENAATRPRLLVNATVVPLRNPAVPQAGDPASETILLIENITHRARLEEQLQISDKMASIGLLAAGVAHEVNTPLTGISSYTQMLLEGADPEHPRTKVLEKIERQTFRAAKIVNGLLTLSRQGGSMAERGVVDLNVVIADVLSLLEHQLEIGKIKVRRELLVDPVTVMGVEHQLQQVFLNLFLNARDAMPKGGWMSVSTRRDAGRVVVDVADTGSGIAPEHLTRIFDPFFTTKGIGRGTGLGLSVSYGIVHEHGGEIRCESAVGVGTRFIVAVPAATSILRSAAH